MPFPARVVPVWRQLPRAILVLGAVSFFTDLSSEMIYPLLPAFLALELGAGAIALGLIEGLAESTASLLRIVSGVWTDRLRRRRPFILGGYGLSGLVRPLIGLAAVWPTVLLLRFCDRIGKGIRSAPRDALIADVTDPAWRGQAYGLHRSMDHAGAVAGPLVAALLLGWLHLPVRQVFLAAAVPAVIVLAIILAGVREPVAGPAADAPPKRMGRWTDLGGEFKALLVGVVFFTFGRPTDVFLVKRVTDAGVSAPVIALLWAALHLVKMTATWYGGRLVDRVGGRRSMVGGWLLHAVLYGALAFVEQPEAVIALFLAYGLVYGFVEPAERAWVAQLVPSDLRGTAFGYYHGIVGAASLPAGICFGWVWGAFGPAPAFLLGAGLGLTGALVLARLPRTGSIPTAARRSDSAAPP